MPAIDTPAARRAWCAAYRLLDELAARTDPSGLDPATIPHADRAPDTSPVVAAGSFPARIHPAWLAPPTVDDAGAYPMHGRRAASDRPPDGLPRSRPQPGGEPHAADGRS